MPGPRESESKVFLWVKGSDDSDDSIRDYL